MMMKACPNEDCIARYGCPHSEEHEKLADCYDEMFLCCPVCQPVEQEPKKVEQKQTKKGGSMAQNRYVIKQEPEPVKPKLVELEESSRGVNVLVEGYVVFELLNDGSIYRAENVCPDQTGLPVDDKGRVRIKGMRNS